MANLISRSLGRAAAARDLHKLGVIADPLHASRREAYPIPRGLGYYRAEHEALLVHYPNEYTRRYWDWPSWRASGTGS